MMRAIDDEDLVIGLRKRAANPMVDKSTAQYLVLAAERLESLTAGANRRKRKGPRPTRRKEPGAVWRKNGCDTSWKDLL